MKLIISFVWSVAVLLLAASTQVLAETRSLVQDEEYVSPQKGAECIRAVPQNGKVIVNNVCPMILRVEYCLERPRVDPNSPTTDKLLAAIAAGNTLAPLCGIGSAGVIVTEPVGKGIKFSDGVPSTGTVDSMTAPDVFTFAASESRITSYDSRVAEYMRFIACPKNDSPRLTSINSGVCIDNETRNRLQRDREKQAEEISKPKTTEADDIFSSALSKSPERLQLEQKAQQDKVDSFSNGSGGLGFTQLLGIAGAAGMLNNIKDIDSKMTTLRVLNGEQDVSDALVGAVLKDAAKRQARQLHLQQSRPQQSRPQQSQQQQSQQQQSQQQQSQQQQLQPQLDTSHSSGISSGGCQSSTVYIDGTAFHDSGNCATH